MRCRPRISPRPGPRPPGTRARPSCAPSSTDLRRLADMELLIVRHAIACERDAQRWPDDTERPLSPRGVLRARQAARGVKRLVPRPARVLTSPSLRAQQTAAILTEFARWPPAPL